MSMVPTVKELFAIMNATATWADHLATKRLLFHCDNTGPCFDIIEFDDAVAEYCFDETEHTG